jgi:hypothetical protein
MTDQKTKLHILNTPFKPEPTEDRQKRYWKIELTELSSIKKSDDAALKAFLSKRGG